MDAAIIQATGQVQTMLGVFFDNRHLKITTESVRARQQKIFLPVPCISVDANGITEDGTVLALGTDVLLYQPKDGLGKARGQGWLEKKASSGLFLNSSIPPWWTSSQQGISISGHFGYETVPPEIQKLAAWLAARFLGWLIFVGVKADGVSETAMNLEEPDWVKDIKRAWKVSTYDEQSFQFEVIV